MASHLSVDNYREVRLMIFYCLCLRFTIKADHPTASFRPQNFTLIIPSDYPSDTPIYRFEEDSIPRNSFDCLELKFTSDLSYEHHQSELQTSNSTGLYSQEQIALNRTTGKVFFNSSPINGSIGTLRFKVFVRLGNNDTNCFNHLRSSLAETEIFDIKIKINSPPVCFRHLNFKIQNHSLMLRLVQENSTYLLHRKLSIVKDFGTHSRAVSFNETSGELSWISSHAISDCKGTFDILAQCYYTLGDDNVTESALVSIICPTTSKEDMKTMRNDEDVNVFVLKSDVNRNASIFTKVLQLVEPKPLSLLTFLPDENTPEGLLALDKETGILYVNDSGLFDQCQKDAELLFDLQLQSNSSVKKVRISISVTGEASQCTKFYNCSSFDTADECENACGYGAPTSRCEWRYQWNWMAVTATFSTCSPDLTTCPDKVCDDWEKKTEICWQDCTQNVRFGWKNEKSQVGIAKAVGPCKCSEIGVCSCRITEENDLSSTERSFRNDTKENQSFLLGEPSSFSQRPDWCGRYCTIFGPILLLVLGISMILVVVFLRNRRPFQLPVICRGIKSRNFNELDGTFDSISSDYLSDDFITWKRAARVVHDSRWEFSRNNLIFDKVLGEGEYGRVLKAQALNIRGHTGYTPVAVKMMKATASPTDVQDFVRELELLKQVNHPNVIRLLGAVTTKGPFLVIVEYCEHGALRTFLRANRKRAPVFNENQDSSFHVPSVDIGRHELTSYAWQICRGMHYLSCLKFVHRDLAARNILVTSDYVMKISDFGLSRDIYEEETYVKKGKGRLPVKWMAVEVLYDNICTTKSDVWSFGVLLWEIMTMGASPYPGVTSERLFQILKDGYRMEKPEDCCTEIYEVMLRCWKENPDDRPTFLELSEFFENLLEENVDYVDFISDANEDASEGEL